MLTSSDQGRTYIAPTYLLTDIPAFVDSITYRMLADGMILQDVRAARGQVHDWAAWCPFWMDKAHEHEALADAALEKGYRLTAGEHLVRASLCAHYGQFLYFAFPEVKQAAVELKVELFARAAPLIRYPAEQIDIPHTTPLASYLRVPDGPGPFPCLVFVGGLDAAKEDAYQFSTLCLDRGLAVLAFDGPGQGEAFYRGMLMDGEFHRSVSAVIDYLGTRPEIDAGRIGVAGRSTGGFLAPHAAALDDRIKACVVWGAMYQLDDFEDMPPLIKDGFQFVTASRDWDEAEQAMSFVNLTGFAERISCPFYVLHGGKDNITPPKNAERMIAEATGPTELHLYPDSIHCNHDVAYIARPDMADWLAANLRRS